MELYPTEVKIEDGGLGAQIDQMQGAGALKQLGFRLFYRNIVITCGFLDVFDDRFFGNRTRIEFDPCTRQFQLKVMYPV